MCLFNYGLLRKWLNQKIEELVKLANAQDANGIKSKLKEIIPEYQPTDSLTSFSSQVFPSTK